MSTIDVRLEPAWSITVRANLIPIEKPTDDCVARPGTPVPATLTITRVDDRSTVELDTGGVDMVITLGQATALLRDVVSRTMRDDIRQQHDQSTADDPPADGAR